jgi:hypothetical protein
LIDLKILDLGYAKPLVLGGFFYRKKPPNPKNALARR